MSCWFCGPGTIDAAVTLLRMSGVGSVPLAPFLASALDDPGVPRWDVSRHPDQVGAELLRLNREAMACRYGDRLDEEELVHMERACREYRFEPSSDDPMVLVKSLNCWLYQCSEGGLQERALWRLCDEVSKLWTPYDPMYAGPDGEEPDPETADWPWRAEALSRYRAAPWGIERGEVGEWMRGSGGPIRDVTPAWVRGGGAGPSSAAWVALVHHGVREAARAG